MADDVTANFRTFYGTDFIKKRRDGGTPYYTSQSELFREYGVGEYLERHEIAEQEVGIGDDVVKKKDVSGLDGGSGGGGGGGNEQGQGTSLNDLSGLNGGGSDKIQKAMAPSGSNVGEKIGKRIAFWREPEHFQIEVGNDVAMVPCVAHVSVHRSSQFGLYLMVLYLLYFNLHIFNLVAQ